MQLICVILEHILKRNLHSVGLVVHAHAFQRDLKCYLSSSRNATKKSLSITFLIVTFY